MKKHLLGMPVKMLWRGTYVHNDVYIGAVIVSPGPGRKQFRPPVDLTAIGKFVPMGRHSVEVERSTASAAQS